MISTHSFELFSAAVLKVLEANNTRFGLEAAAVRLFVKQFGFEPTAEEMLRALEYLAGKGLIEEMPKVLVKVNRAWKITDAGREYLDEHNI